MYEYRIQDFDKLLKRFEPDLVYKAERAALNRAAMRTRTFISGRIRQTYAVKAGAISKRVHLIRAVTGQRYAAIRYRGPRIGLINFSAKEKRVTLGRKPRRGQKGQPWGRFRTGVSVKVLKQGMRRLVTTQPGFIATGKNGNRHIFARRGDDRNYLWSLKTRSIPEMVIDAQGEAGSNDEYSEFAADAFDKEFDAGLQFFLERAGNARGN